MGPWSADLPDVSPPEKQLACQRARLYLNTHSNMLSFVHAGNTGFDAKKKKKKLWFEVMVRCEEKEEGIKRKKKRGERFECHVHSRVAVCGLQG